MSESKHLPGPLEVYENHGAYVKEPGFAVLALQQRDVPNITVALIISDIPEIPHKAHAERLRDCWIACEGLNPEAVPELVEAANKLLASGTCTSSLHAEPLKRALAKAREGRP